MRLVSADIIAATFLPARLYFDPFGMLRRSCPTFPGRSFPVGSARFPPRDAAFGAQMFAAALLIGLQVQRQRIRLRPGRAIVATREGSSAPGIECFRAAVVARGLREISRSVPAYSGQLNHFKAPLPMAFATTYTQV